VIVVSLVTSWKPSARVVACQDVAAMAAAMAPAMSSQLAVSRLEVTAARLRELVELRPAIVFRLPPFGLQPALLLETMKRGKEGAGLDVERPASDLGDPARYAKAVIGPERERPQNQQIECPLKNPT
jgi:hypothetical protein